MCAGTMSSRIPSELNATIKKRNVNHSYFFGNPERHSLVLISDRSFGHFFCTLWQFIHPIYTRIDLFCQLSCWLQLLNSFASLVFSPRLRWHQMGSLGIFKTARAACRPQVKTRCDKAWFFPHFPFLACPLTCLQLFHCCWNGRQLLVGGGQHT